jgi:nucleotide-binding universal stress UspA family protein
MVNRIIVGVDDSGPSRAALRWALHRADSPDIEVVLEHVVDDEWGQVGAEYAHQEALDGQRVLERAVDAAMPSGRSVHLITAHGSPAWTLAQEAGPDDLIVVGTHKTGYLRGRVLGTRSIVVASVARSSVVVVPEDNLALRRGVVVGVAAGPHARPAIIAGAAEAERLGEELFLVHAAPELPETAELGRSLLAAAAELAGATAPGITVRRRVAHRRPSDTLLDASRTAALLVLGESRTDPDRGGFIGSVTHEVLLNLNSPVMVAR